MEVNLLIKLLGNNSYPAIVQDCKDILMEGQSDTIIGKDLLSRGFVALKESKTPVMQLREFTTNAEQLAPNDLKLGEVIAALRKRVGSGDMNFLANLALEEHWVNQTRAGLPTSESTIKEIKTLFNEPANVVEAAIKQGLLDKLDSNLLMELKMDLGATKNKIVDNVMIDGVEVETPSEALNESVYLGENTFVYNPVGIKLDTPNGVVFLLENTVLSFDSEKGFSKLNESIDIPAAHKALSNAINVSDYDPESNIFGLVGDWDFEMKLYPETQQVTITRPEAEIEIEVSKDDVQELLLESARFYRETNPNFNQNESFNNIDNFMLLVENCSKLLQFDNLSVLKNVENNDFMLFESFSFTPKVIDNNINIEPNKLFESFIDLGNVINSKFDINPTPLFENQLNFENEFFKQRQLDIANLKDKQNELNKLLENSGNLLNSVDKNSPAWNKLYEKHQQLNESLNYTIGELTSANNADSLQPLYENKGSIYHKDQLDKYVQLNESALTTAVKLAILGKTAYDAHKIYGEYKKSKQDESLNQSTSLAIGAVALGAASGYYKNKRREARKAKKLNEATGTKPIRIAKTGVDAVASSMAPELTGAIKGISNAIKNA